MVMKYKQNFLQTAKNAQNRTKEIQDVCNEEPYKISKF